MSRSIPHRAASALSAMLAGVAMCGCMGDAIAQNQREIEAQQAQLQEMSKEIAALKAGQTYSTAAPAPGACDQAVEDAANKRGGDSYAAGDYSKALGYYQDAVTACPNSAQGELNVARAYEALGQRDQAVAHFQRVGKLASPDQQAVANQAQEALTRLQTPK